MSSGDNLPSTHSPNVISSAPAGRLRPPNVSYSQLASESSAGRLPGANQPFLNEAFSTVPPTLAEWLTSLAVASLVLWTEEARQLVTRAR